MTLLTVILAALLIAPAAHASTVGQAKKEIRRLWGRNAPTMLCIVQQESGWNPRAVSRTNDHGLTQIHYTWARYFGRRWRLRYDPVANVRMGFAIYRNSGFGAWTTYRYCRG